MKKTNKVVSVLLSAIMVITTLAPMSAMALTKMSARIVSAQTATAPTVQFSKADGDVSSYTLMYKKVNASYSSGSSLEPKDLKSVNNTEYSFAYIGANYEFESNTDYVLLINAYDSSHNLIAETGDIPYHSNPGTVTLKKENAQQKSLSFSWQMANGLTFDGIAGVEVQKYINNAWNTVTTLATDVTNYTDENLTPKTTYKYRARAYSTVSNVTYYSGWSKELAVTTADYTSTQTGTNQISGLKVTGRAANSISYSWNAQTDVDGYIVNLVQNGKTVKSTTVTDNKATVSGLSANSSYIAYVYSFRYDAETGNKYTNMSCRITTITLPGKVQHLVTSKRSTNSLTIQWNKQSGVTGYCIYKYDSKKKKYVYVKTVNSKTNTYSESKLITAGTYFYKVRSYRTYNKQNYYGAYSDFLKTVTYPSKVNNIKVGKRGCYYVNLSWNKVSRADGYRVYKYVKSKKKYVYVCTTKKNSVKVSNLPDNTNYIFMVRAYKTINNKGCYQSPFSKQTKTRTYKAKKVKFGYKGTFSVEKAIAELKVYAEGLGYYWNDTMNINNSNWCAEIGSLAFNNYSEMIKWLKDAIKYGEDGSGSKGCYGIYIEFLFDKSDNSYIIIPVYGADEDCSEWNNSSNYYPNLIQVKK